MSNYESNTMKKMSLRLSLRTSFPKRTLLCLLALAPLQNAQANWAQQEKFVGTEATPGDLFGYSVFLSGDSVFVGAQSRLRGIGEVFVGTTGPGVSSTFVALKPPGDASSNAGGYFGNALVEKNGTLFVGAQRRNIPGSTEGSVDVEDAGAVHVYQKNALGTWEWSQTLVAGAPGANDQFGTSLAFDGESLVVSAPRRDSAGVVDSGAVYVFRESSPGNWVQSQVITAPTPAGNDLFGRHVAVSGNKLLIAAPLADGQAADEGRVFAYTADASGSTWQLSQTLQAQSAFERSEFGFSLDLQGDTVAVGSPWDEVDGVISGAVHLFEFSGTEWTAKGRLSPAVVSGEVEFGGQVDLSSDGKTLAVGAPSDGTTKSLAGAIHLFSKTDSTWTEQQKIASSSPALFDEFGREFMVEGKTLLVGVRNDDTAGRQAGAGYLFLNEATDPEPTPLPAPLGSLLSLSFIGGGLLTLRRRFSA